MVRFMWAVRTAFNDKKKRWIFVGVLAALSLALFFLPFLWSPGKSRSLFSFVFYFDLKGWSDFQAATPTEANLNSLITAFVLPLGFAIIAIAGDLIAAKIKPFIALNFPLCAYALYCCIIDKERLVPFPFEDNGYAEFFIFFALLVILFVVFLLLALYLPLKEPAPRPERPKRERKPTKDERIAELERQVAALRGKERDEG